MLPRGAPVEEDVVGVAIFLVAGIAASSLVGDAVAGRFLPVTAAGGIVVVCDDDMMKV